MNLSNRQIFLNNQAQTSEAPLMLEIESAEGIYLTDNKGKKYIDLISGISVSNLGHRHPKVVEAIKEQVDKYLYLMVYGEYVQSPQVKLAELLSANLPPVLDNIYFVNSGTEAVEGAIKLAKRHTNRQEIISMNNCYHGSTHGALSLMSAEHFKTPFRPLLPGIKHITFNSEKDLELITTKTACVITETIQGESGCTVPSVPYMKKLRERCNETGTILILDEIQCGFGRTGTLFAFEQFGITPDILLLAKGMGGGMPIGAFIAPHHIMHSLMNNPPLGHITTFGGHPVSCAAALANLEVLASTDLIKKVKEKEVLFRKLLKHPMIKDIRGTGLMLALELENFEFNKKIIDGCISQGVIVDWFLHSDNCLRIAPPLIISNQEIEYVCETILKVFNFS